TCTLFSYTYVSTTSDQRAYSNDRMILPPPCEAWQIGADKRGGAPAAGSGGPARKARPTAAGDGGEPPRGTGRDLFDEDYDQRDQALRKLVLKNSQEIRDLMHQTGDFWLVPATSKPFAAGLEAGKEYGKAVRAAGKKHGLGSPHVHVAMATLRSLHDEIDGEQGSALEKSSKQVIREFVEATNHTKGNILVEEMILAFKVQETHKREDLDAGDRLGKISFTLNPTPCLQAKLANHEVGEQAMEAVKVYEVMKLKTAITIGVQSINGKKATGPGPKTALERSVESTSRRR
ncbi:unnamed protein product, partial [Prorocentrum cordatum]